jgi:3,4-dihydroxy 2-butanone 4-phosphate synthase/GTP cyclohydrolase II
VCFFLKQYFRKLNNRIISIGCALADGVVGLGVEGLMGAWNESFSLCDSRAKFCCNTAMTSVSERLSHFAQSRLCVLQDDVGDKRCVLISPAQETSDQIVNRILLCSGGLTFVALTPERAAALMLTPMFRNLPRGHTPQLEQQGQYVSVEAREGVTTGISTSDRATTIRLLGAISPQPRALVKPGHIFPVETKPGGSLVKAAIPEAAVDLAILAGFTDAALFVDFLDTSGEFLSVEGAREWASSQAVPIFSISEIIQYRLRHEPLVTRLAQATIPTHAAGEVLAVAYRSRIHDVEHVALIKGTLDTSQPVLVRVQVENTVADVFGTFAPPSRKQILNSLRALAEHGSGVVLYLRRSMLGETAIFQENPTQSPSNESSATESMREYGVGAQILRDLGISRIELLSSTQRALMGLDSFDIRVTSQRPIPEYTDNYKEQTS